MAPSDRLLSIQSSEQNAYCCMGLGESATVTGMKDEGGGETHIKISFMLSTSRHRVFG